MKEITATVTSKGHVTIPVAIRERLGINAGGMLAFVIEDDGKIELRAPTYPTIASLLGAAGSLATPLSWDEMRAIAREDRANFTNIPTSDPHFDRTAAIHRQEP